MNRILAAGVGLVIGPVVAGDGLVVPGKRVPNLENLHWIHGDPVNRFETDRVYVLEFWSTWCGACVQSVDGLNELARRYKADATFVAVHIWQRESAPKPVEFMESRMREGKPFTEFSVAEDVNGAVARAWMDATQNTGLPTAMIVDRTARLAWFGHVRDLERPLEEVIAGTFDLTHGSAEMNRRIRMGRLANESGEAIQKGEYDRGSRLMLEALDAAPNTVAAWIPSTYGHLLAASRSPEVAAKFARAVLATDAGKERDLLAGLAYAILHFQPKELRDLDLALTLARRANTMGNGTDPQILSTLAMVLAELDDIPGAIRLLELGNQNAPNEDTRKILGKSLESLRGLPRD